MDMKTNFQGIQYWMLLANDFLCHAVFANPVQWPLEASWTEVVCFPILVQEEVQDCLGKVNMTITNRPPSKMALSEIIRKHP